MTIKSYVIISFDFSYLRKPSYRKALTELKNLKTNAQVLVGYMWVNIDL